jgi:hypothetical protein
MSAPTTLGTFVPPAGPGKATSFDPRYNTDKPLIVVLREFRENFTTQRFPNPRNVVIVDVVDLMADEVHASVIWGAAAIVDRLKGVNPGEPLPVVIQNRQSAAGNTYTTVEPLDGQGLQFAQAWYAKFPTRIDEVRAAREAERQAAQQAQNGNGAAPAQGAPLQGMGQPVAQTQAPAPQATQPVAGLNDDDLAARIAALSN